MMKKIITILTLFVLSFNVMAAEPTKEQAKEDALNKYLVDITGGSVSASGLLGLDKTLITDIQTSQDLVVAISPFTSGEQKAGFGLAFTPAKSDLFPMSGNTYVKNKLNQLIGNLTFSYAQNNEDIGSIKYKKIAASIDTVLYLNINKDPVALGNAVFQKCMATIMTPNQDEIQKITMNPNLSSEEKNKLILELTKKNNESIKPCMDKELSDALEKAKWNSDRISISYGDARISAPGVDRVSLGKHLTINAMVGVGVQSAVNISLRKSKDVLDTSTLATGNLSYSNTNLAAIRYTYGDETGKDMRGLVEISNANKYKGSETKGVFLYAIGIDKKIRNGIWLEFRLGKNKTILDNKKETTGIFNISIQPSLL